MGRLQARGCSKLIDPAASSEWEGYPHGYLNGERSRWVSWQGAPRRMPRVHGGDDVKKWQWRVYLAITDVVKTWVRG